MNLATHPGRSFVKSRRLIYTAGFAATAILLGCGGSGNGNDPDPCKGVASGGSFSLSYRERSRSLSSALSGKLVITNGNPTGGDLTFNFARNTNLAAHTESYSLPSTKTSATSATLSLYASANQTGPVVGTATAVLSASCTSYNLSSFSVNATVQHVAVTPTTVTVGGATAQLAFSATDSHSAVVAVTPGSAVFVGTGTAATVTKTGLVTPIAAGTITVTATVDGVTSAPATITVQPGQTAGTGYKIVDLGPSALISAYSFIASQQMGHRMNDSSKCVLFDLTANHYYIVDPASPASRKLLGGSTDQTQVLSIDSAGDVMGRQLETGAVYWKAPDYTAPIALQGTDIGYGDAANASGAAIASGFINPVYFATLASKGQVMALPTDASLTVTAKDINASGLIVGFETTATTPTKNIPIYYSDYKASPTILPGFTTGADETVSACNDSGEIVGFSSTQIGAFGMIWPSKTSAPVQIGSLMPFGVNNKGVVVGSTIDFGTAAGTASVYTAAQGTKSLFSLCDSTRTGWTFNYAVTVNNSGSIFGQGVLNNAVHTFVAVPKTP